MCPYAPIVPAVLDRVRTVQAGAGEVDDGKDVLGDGGGEEAEGGRPGHWTAAMGMDRALVSAAQNTSEWPDKEEKEQKDMLQTLLWKHQMKKSSCNYSYKTAHSQAEGRCKQGNAVRWKPPSMLGSAEGPSEAAGLAVLPEETQDTIPELNPE